MYDCVDIWKGITQALLSELTGVKRVNRPWLFESRDSNGMNSNILYRLHKNLHQLSVIFLYEIKISFVNLSFCVHSSLLFVVRA